MRRTLPLAAIAILLVPALAEAWRGAGFRRVDLDLSDNPCSIVVSDLDGDDTLDIIAATCPGDLRILYGNADGTFESAIPIPLEAPPGGLAVGDFDGDGAGDVLVGSVGLPQIEAFFGDGARSLGPSAAIASPRDPLRLRMKDVDGDGHQDLVMTTSGSGISILWGDGTRAPSNLRTIPTPSNPIQVELADVDADGATDILSTDCGTTSVYLALGLGSRQFDTVTTVLHIAGYYSCSMRFGALDGDAWPDLVVVDAHSVEGRLKIASGSSGGFATTDSATAGLSPADVVIADLDGDGSTDLATTNSLSGDLSIIAGPGFGDPVATVEGGPCPGQIVAADVNEDGAPDLVVSNTCGHTVSVFINGPPTVTPPSTPRQISKPGAVPIVLRLPPQAQGDAVVRVYDARGRRVRSWETNVDGQLTWDGRSSGGEPLPSGVFQVVVRIGSREWLGRVILVR